MRQAAAEAAPDAVTPSGEFELAATSREALVKQIPIRGGEAMNPDPDKPVDQDPDKPADEATTTAEAATRLRDTIATQFGRSLHIRTLDTGSCAVCEQEIRLLTAPHYDLHRLGFFFTPAPRHADLLLVTGPMVRAFERRRARPTRRCPGPRSWSRPGRARSAASTARTRSCTARWPRSSRSTCGYPAARRARWPCCTACGVAVGRLAEKTPGLTFIAEAAEKTPDPGRSRGPQSRR